MTRKCVADDNAEFVQLPKPSVCFRLRRGCRNDSGLAGRNVPTGWMGWAILGGAVEAEFTGHHPRSAVDAAVPRSPRAPQHRFT